MTLTPVPFRNFGSGLNLRDKADAVDPSDCIDCLNVEFTERGAARQRDGYATFTAATTTNQPDSLAAFYTVSGTKQLMIGNGNKLTAVDSAGAAVASSTAPTASPHFFARFGGPTAQLLYCANGTDQVRSWDGAAFAAPAYTGTAPTGKFLAVTPWDNRLVNARRSGTTGGDNPSSVRFSDAGVPTTFGANNYVDLTPGDGEQIMGMAVFRNYLFVFKESKFFVFYGTDTDSAGAPIFRYRAVTSGVGLQASRALAVARDGVYFLGRNGVYKTTGNEDQPTLVSDKISPFFTGQVEQWYLGGVLNTSQVTQAAMTWVDEKLYLAVPTGSSSTNTRMLVYDCEYNWWSLWDIAAGCVASFRVSSADELVFGYAAVSKNVGRHNMSYVNDAGVAISSRWRSGWSDLGSSVEKRIRETKLWGAGQIQYAPSRDYGEATQNAAVDFDAGLDTWGDGTGTDTWGGGTSTSDLWGPTGGVLNPKLARLAIRGTVFSVSITNQTLSAGWQLHRLDHHVGDRRDASVLQTEVAA